VRRALKAVKYEATVPEILLADADPSLTLPACLPSFLSDKKDAKKK
jgi:hypothetical protein